MNGLTCVYRHKGHTHFLSNTNFPLFRRKSVVIFQSSVCRLMHLQQPMTVPINSWNFLGPDGQICMYETRQARGLHSKCDGSCPTLLPCLDSAAVQGRCLDNHKTFAAREQRKQIINHYKICMLQNLSYSQLLRVGGGDSKTAARILN